LRKCSICGIEKPLTEFYKEKTGWGGYRSDCKACFAGRSKKNYAKNREREIARVKKWQEENRERHLGMQRKRRSTPEYKAREREAHLKRKFGITAAQYDAMLASQGGVCAICGDAPKDDVSLHVDHEHGSGRVRGLLCMRCNNALGLLKEDEELLWSALTYLGADRRIRSLKAL